MQFLKRTRKWVRQIFWVSFAIMACQFRKGFYLFLMENQHGSYGFLLMCGTLLWAHNFKHICFARNFKHKLCLQFQTYATMMCITMYCLINFLRRKTYALQGRQLQSVRRNGIRDDCSTASIYVHFHQFTPISTFFYVFFVSLENFG